MTAMNTKESRNRREKRLRELDKERAAAAAKPARDLLVQQTPDKLPDPWLFDSQSLLGELDRCRELVLQIPISSPNATHFGINVAVSALWNLRDNLRHLLAMHRDMQRDFAKRAERLRAPVAPAELKVRGIRAH
jgi:hypothetical protein